MFKSERLALSVILLVHFGLSLIFSLSTPLWESYDETGHYSYARYIATHKSLPPIGSKIAPYDETHQPPLYYLAVALGIFWVDASDDQQPDMVTNPTVKRMWVNPSSSIDTLPFTGTALGIRVGRLISIAIGTCTVALTFFTAKLIFNKRKIPLSLLATSIHALWPMWLFLNGAISNDVGISFFGSLCILLAASLIYKPEINPNRYAFYLAICIGLAVMTKDSAVSLVIYALSAVVIWYANQWRRNRIFEWRVLCIFLATVMSLVILGFVLSGGRTLRQFSLTAGFVSEAVQSSAPTEVTLSSPYVGYSLTNLTSLMFDSFFGVFSWGGLRMPPLWYSAFHVTALVTIAGVAFVSLNRSKDVRLLLPSLLAFCVFIAPAARSVMGENPGLLFGRFHMPAMTGYAILIAVGLSCFGKFVATVALAGIAYVALASPLLVLQAAYHRPEFILDPYRAPIAMKQTLEITYAESIKLLGYTIDERTNPEKGAIVQLFWRSLKPLDKDYQLRIDMFDIHEKSLGSFIETVPKVGFPTSAWQPSDTFSEFYYLPIWPQTPVPTQVIFRVIWIDPVSKKSLPFTCITLPNCDAKLGILPVQLNPDDLARLRTLPALAQYDDDIELIQAQVSEFLHVGQKLEVPLIWRAKKRIQKNATVFIHILNSQGELVAQQDAQPLNALYPTTAWQIEDIIPDKHIVDQELPVGSYTIQIGLYDSQTLIRKGVMSANPVVKTTGNAVILRLWVEAEPAAKTFGLTRGVR